MKKGSYCGRENEDANANCRECGIPFEEAPLGVDDWHSLSLFPRTAHEWTRSIALPLFAGCIAIFLWYLTGSFDHSRIWHCACPAITNGFLSLLGVALSLTCHFGVGLHRGFRILALMVALLSVLIGLTLPGLAT